MDLAAALHAEGLCCVVGAGGKKTTLYRLADEFERSVVTATVRIPIFDEHVAEVVCTDDPGAAIASAREWPLGVVPAREREDRYLGYEPAVLEDLARPEDLPILVKADGARMRRFKAPNAREPQIPRSADTVVAIASAHVIGQPLDDDLVHRVPRVTALTGAMPGEPITPEVVAEVLAHEDGGRKGVPEDATFVPLINMVDDEEDLEHARAVAAAIHRRIDVPHVVLTSMREPDPIVDLV